MNEEEASELWGAIHRVGRELDDILNTLDVDEPILLGLVSSGEGLPMQWAAIYKGRVIAARDTTSALKGEVAGYFDNGGYG